MTYKCYQDFVDDFNRGFISGEDMDWDHIEQNWSDDEIEQWVLWLDDARAVMKSEWLEWERHLLLVKFDQLNRARQYWLEEHHHWMSQQQADEEQYGEVMA